jgi:hypothetical protein
LLGIGVGRIGMSVKDFDGCTPHEFKIIMDEWEKSHVRDEWERTRMMCLCMIQPHTSEKLSARDVMKFAWDKEEQKVVAKKRSKEEEDEHWKEVMKKRLNN